MSILDFGSFSESRQGGTVFHQFRESKHHARNTSPQKLQFGLGVDQFATPGLFIPFDYDEIVKVSVPVSGRPNPAFSGFTEVILPGFPGYTENPGPYAAFIDYMYNYTKTVETHGLGAFFKFRTRRPLLPRVWGTKSLYPQQEYLNATAPILGGLIPFAAKFISFDLTQEKLISPPSMAVGYQAPPLPGFISAGPIPPDGTLGGFYAHFAQIDTNALFGRATNFYSELTVYKQTWNIGFGYNGNFGFAGVRTSVN